MNVNLDNKTTCVAENGAGVLDDVFKDIERRLVWAFLQNRGIRKVHV